MDASKKPERPNFPAGYGISAKKKGLLTWEWVDEQMTKSRNYWISTTSPDGKPHVAPVWGVWLEGALYFSGDRQARRTRNLLARPDVVVHLESGDEVVIMEGIAEDVTDIPLLKRIAKVYGDKYPPFKPDFTPNEMNVTTCVKPRKVLAWLEKDYPNTATRWRFDAE